MSWYKWIYDPKGELTQGNNWTSMDSYDAKRELGALRQGNN